MRHPSRQNKTNSRSSDAHNCANHQTFFVILFYGTVSSCTLQDCSCQQSPLRSYNTQRYTNLRHARFCPMFSYLVIRHPKQFSRSGVLGARGDAAGHTGGHLHTVQGTVHQSSKSSASTAGYTKYLAFCKLWAEEVGSQCLADVLLVNLQT